MVGLGGLEPPTSPLSGAFVVLYAQYYASACQAGVCYLRPLVDILLSASTDRTQIVMRNNGSARRRFEKPPRVNSEECIGWVGETLDLRERKVKYAAWFLLIMLLLDLSTAGICSAGTFPGADGRGDFTLSTGSRAEAPAIPNLDDDGCFCCCTHVLPGAVFFLASLVPATSTESIFVIASPSASPQAPFHPPKP
jgi:hypothetical protein